MSENGKNAMKLINQIKNLYKEISLVLQTADKLMEDHKWKPKAGNTAVTWSYHLAYPDWWIPQDIFRFYFKEGYEHILPFISVILFDRDNETKLSEPLISAGYFDYGIGNTITTWEYWYSHFHIKQDNFKDDGELAPILLNDPEKYTFKNAYSLAKPLMQIYNSQSLLDEIVKPLLDGI